MPSQNVSILYHAKAACLGCIIDGTRLNLGMIIAQEMVMRVKQRHTSLPFSLSITKLCRWARVLRGVKKDVEMIPTSSTDIWRIEAEHLKDEAIPVDSYPVVDTDSLPAEALLPTPTHGTSGTPCVVPSDTPGSFVAALPPRPAAAISRTPLTQALLLWIEQLAHSADRRAARLEASISSMIQTTLADAGTPLSAAIDDLATRIAVCERGQGATEEVIALKAAIVVLRSDMH
ncbi:hypothetical protein AABB24_020331 [Solanum stoloniferum]|uniref:Putative plant transposon protein domain-containing protein n=1 Tax=Solanum stoloniferum TaxID=62892 RepID=A0ABD2T8C7_9SOLN